MPARKLLMVDDEVGFTNLTKLNLEKTGRFEVRIENNGEQALLAAREFGPDLILLDLVMPDRDGGEVLAELRADPAVQHVPVAFLTATISVESVAARGNKINGVPFIAKPITPKELIEEIEIILKQNR